MEKQKRFEAEELIRMAQKAGISKSHAEGMISFLREFADLVAAAAAVGGAKAPKQIEKKADK
jgi:hypothetical protein